MSHHHANPVLSIFLGAAFSIGTYFTEHPFIVENFVSLLKVIFFGVVGGASGYVGRLGIIAIQDRIKKNQNE